MKHLIQLLAAAVTVTACGNDSAPDAPDARVQLTWHDAEAVWADGWCNYFSKCFPEQFGNTDTHQGYTGQSECVADVTERNCRDGTCTDPYPPDREQALATCHEQMLAIACDAMEVPYACRFAFQ